MLKDMKVSEFTEELASSSPAPGGGSASSLVGAMGAALGSMVCALTEGRERYRDVWEEMSDVRKGLQENMAQLMELVDRDTEAFNRVMDAFSMPKGSDEEKARRKEAIQEALKGAAASPMEMCRLCLNCMRLMKTVAEKGNPNSITDAGCGALFAWAALRGAALNVRINLSSIRDQEFTDKMSEELSGLLSEGEELLRKIMAVVEDRMG
ncbi:MAG: methenyltetrahydrofolate cyclohydrolase [Deltaproteobacteria bacterium]|nr:MAG: methenyltetrahydrofolate cyclohydrolase [Deltaproteobacteria bacterium]